VPLRLQRLAFKARALLQKLRPLTEHASRLALQARAVARRGFLGFRSFCSRERVVEQRLRPREASD
jgi:hypothetical protein